MNERAQAYAQLFIARCAQLAANTTELVALIQGTAHEMGVIYDRQKTTDAAVARLDREVKRLHGRLAAQATKIEQLTATTRAQR